MGYLSYLGYADDEIPNTQEAWQRLVHPDDQPMIFEAVANHIKSHGQTPYNIEVRYLHKNGSLVFVISEQGVIVDCNQKFAEMLGGESERLLHRNIADFMLAEEAPSIITGDATWQKYR